MSQILHMTKLLHEIVHSEITFGILIMRNGDGTRGFFSELPERFDLDLRGEMLFDRRVGANKLWLGYTQTRKFRPGEVIQIFKENDHVMIK